MNVEIIVSAREDRAMAEAVMTEILSPVGGRVTRRQGALLGVSFVSQGGQDTLDRVREIARRLGAWVMCKYLKAGVSGEYTCNSDGEVEHQVEFTMGEGGKVRFVAYRDGIMVSDMTQDDKGHWHGMVTA